MTTDRYKNGKIYKLVSDISDKIYIGSCCVALPIRLYRHKFKYIQETQGIGCVGSPRELFKLGGIVSIILIELFPCNNKMELEKRERYWIESLKCVNYRIPTRTIEEYREKNKDKICEKNKEYREKNKDKICEKNRIWREENKDKIKRIKKNYKESHRQELCEKQKEYYKQNKEKILASTKTPIVCPFCNKQMRSGSLTRHKKTQHAEEQEPVLIFID